MTSQVRQDGGEQETAERHSAAFAQIASKHLFANNGLHSIQDTHACAACIRMHTRTQRANEYTYQYDVSLDCVIRQPYYCVPSHFEAILATHVTLFRGNVALDYHMRPMMSEKA